MTRRGSIRSRSSNILLVFLVGMVLTYWVYLKNTQGAHLAKMKERWAQADQEEVEAGQREVEEEQRLIHEKEQASQKHEPIVKRRKTEIILELDYKVASGKNAKIIIDMWKDVAPITAANFIALVRADYFDKDAHFYRAEEDFLLQGGMRPNNRFDRPKKPLYNPIKLEANYRNERGTISMARLSGPDTATTEFFINLADNPGLDAKESEPKGKSGYAVFGKVREGMDVIDEISKLKASKVDGLRILDNPVTILSAASKSYD
eukprot:TRINITY_DN1017_c3_g1_i1.p1 TRINITY_DN1017_c3_g1~~TRINITY_DN1017_c3_g1_i1.p1  ORF type:complete len:262 (+),score=54.73 TRINITY_DN1017_c3_g1_i1:92-877(+)